MKLTPAQEKFMVHWGEMGSRWGVNRTVGQTLLIIRSALLRSGGAFDRPARNRRSIDMQDAAPDLDAVAGKTDNAVDVGCL